MIKVNNIKTVLKLINTILFYHSTLSTYLSVLIVINRNKKSKSVNAIEIDKYII